MIAGDNKKSVAKDTNPKDAVGIRKVPFSTVPAVVTAEVGLGMLEGARKYRRHNYRIAGVRASVYYDAMKRHLESWWEGQDIDPASGLHHIVKLLSSGYVLRDAMLNDKVTDDRPPPMKNQNWVDDLNAKAGEIIDRYPNGLPPYTRDDVEQDASDDVTTKAARDALSEIITGQPRVSTAVGCQHGAEFEANLGLAMKPKPAETLYPKTLIAGDALWHGGEVYAVIKNICLLAPITDVDIAFWLDRKRIVPRKAYHEKPVKPLRIKKAKKKSSKRKG